MMRYGDGVWSIYCLMGGVFRLNWVEHLRLGWVGQYGKVSYCFMGDLLKKHLTSHFNMYHRCGVGAPPLDTTSEKNM